jgi:DNA-binding response OmpR family regulator
VSIRRCDSGHLPEEQHKALVNRIQQSFVMTDVIKIGKFILSQDGLLSYNEGEPEKLPAIETGILYCLHANLNNMVDRKTLVLAGWDKEYSVLKTVKEVYFISPAMDAIVTWIFKLIGRSKLLEARRKKIAIVRIAGKQYFDDNTIGLYINRLRRSLQKDFSLRLEKIERKGYRLCDGG